MMSKSLGVMEKKMETIIIYRAIYMDHIQFLPI